MLDTKNKYAVKDVNVKTGPRTGNAGTMSKRSEFKAAKEERAPLAKVIQNAYAKRNVEDSVNPKLEGISPNTETKKFKR